jgi:predicted ATPase
VSSRRTSANLTGPFLRRIAISPQKVDLERYPFNIPAFSHGIDIKITSNVTFFV